MAKSKQSKERSANKEAYKQNAKTKAKQKAIPKEHLTPIPNWKSTDELILRGDIMEAIDQEMAVCFQGLQQAGHSFQQLANLMQMIMQINIQAKKITLDYKWNNGEQATEQEIEDFKEHMKKLREHQQQMLKDQQAEQQKQKNAAKTGLVSPDGAPIATTQDLDETPEAAKANEAAGLIESEEKEVVE